MIEYTVLYEEGPTSWGASVPDLPGCFAVGVTFEETESLIREAIELYIEELVNRGERVPSPTHSSGLVAVTA